MAFVIFTAINNLGQTIILMGSFIVKENFNAYKFVLSSFEEFFGIPSTVMTDQDPALKLAIEDQWRDTYHLFCLFHIYRNIQKKVAQYLGAKNEKFLKDFSTIQKIEDPCEFENELESFITQYTGPSIVKEEAKGEVEEDELLQEIVVDKHEFYKEISVHESFEELVEKISEQKIPNYQKIGDYLRYLSKSRYSWARCYTYRHFGTGSYFKITTLTF